MTYFRFLRFMLLASLVVKGSALANRKTPKSELNEASSFSKSEQSLFGGYSYGEGCLFGGSGSFGAQHVWTGKQEQNDTEIQAESTAPTFISKMKSNKMSFIPRK